MNLAIWPVLKYHSFGGPRSLELPSLQGCHLSPALWVSSASKEGLCEVGFFLSANEEPLCLGRSVSVGMVPAGQSPAPGKVQCPVLQEKGQRLREVTQSPGKPSPQISLVKCLLSPEVGEFKTFPKAPR